jgi:hypothetical protein
MRNLKILIILFALFVLSSGQNVYAQNSRSEIRRETIKKLTALKPPNTKEYVYKLNVPQKTPVLPENLRLDFVYKIGHYEFQYVALRFEKEKNTDFVNVTRFIYGSALGFWREYSDYAKGDGYIAEQGKLAVADFDKLLNLAYLLHQSNIESEFINSKKPPKRFADGLRRGYGVGSKTYTYSSADGSIIFNLLDAKNDFRPVIKESGTLIAGKLKERLSNGYQQIRTHLFWEVFHDYLEKNNIFAGLDKAKAEEIAVSRLEESPMSNDYHDYYRKSLYVEFLGELGTIKALPILKKLAEGNSLEKDWDKYLKARAEKAIEKIKGRDKSDG